MADKDEQLQLVTFQLGDKLYGINIMDVKEIQRMQETRVIPNAPSFVEGIFKLRSDIIPVINLHRRFHIRKGQISEEDKLLNGIIILDIDGMRLGIIIDRVSRVLTVHGGQVQPPPPIISGIGAEYIVGVVNRDDGYLILLDIRRLFNSRELQQLEAIRG
ncbi:MAG: chemotaxis protein CheW [Spirochaetales bacterium]|jgi:purine-binding chemotaxis protein CheW|nr:chemotaxis protein CheW [Spirochaetales bacterium]